MQRRFRSGEEAALASYYRDVERYPVLTEEQEQALSRRIEKGDPAAIDALVKANLRFVIHVARKFQNQGLSLADLINEGNLGLITAARKFDPSKGCKFITYAVWWIKQNIYKALEVHTRPVRVPANVLNDLSQLRKVERGLVQSLGRAPLEQEIARASTFGIGKVRHAMGAGAGTVSLDEPLYGDAGVSVLDELPDEEADTPDTPLYSQKLRGEVRAALDTLSPRARTILALHYGIDGEEPWTYQQIGRRLGVSRERVRQLKEAALERLRQAECASRLASYAN